MMFSRKVDYALRALFELARRQEDGPVHCEDLAKAQAIPQRFLEVILNQLQRGGFVKSSRGKLGGFILARAAESLSVGEVVTFINGPLRAHCADGEKYCPFVESSGCRLAPLWDRMETAASTIMNATTFSQLVQESARRTRRETALSSPDKS